MPYRPLLPNCDTSYTCYSSTLISAVLWYVNSLQDKKIKSGHTCLSFARLKANMLSAKAPWPGDLPVEPRYRHHPQPHYSLGLRAPHEPPPNYCQEVTPLSIPIRYWRCMFAICIELHEQAWVGSIEPDARPMCICGIILADLRGFWWWPFVAWF